MQAIDVFTVRDLRQRSGELLQHAESGTLAVITKHGRPALLAIPFDNSYWNTASIGRSRCIC